MPASSLQKPAPRALVIAAFAALYIIWGSTYTAILIAIRHIPPIMMAGLRFLIAGAILYTFFRIRGHATPSWKNIVNISIGGILMLFLGTGAVAWVEQYIPSGLAAIIVASTPLWFVLLDKRQWRFNFSNKWILVGLLIGFLGIITLFAGKDALDFSSRIKLISFFVLVIGTIAWTIGSLYSKYRKVDASTGMKAAIQMVAAGVVALITSFLSGEYHRMHPSEVTLESVLALAYLIVMGSLVGFMSYVWLLSVRSATVVGTYAYVNPVVAVFLGWLVADERISSQQLIALGVILAGVVLVTLAKEKTTS